MIDGNDFPIDGELYAVARESYDITQNALERASILLTAKITDILAELNCLQGFRNVYLAPRYSADGRPEAGVTMVLYSHYKIRAELMTMIRRRLGDLKIKPGNVVFT